MTNPFDLIKGKDGEKTGWEGLKSNPDVWVLRKSVTEEASTGSEVLANNISSGQLFESERKTWNVMKNFINSTWEKTFEVDFSSNSQAEHNIWLADLMWEEVRKVRVIWEKNGRMYDMTWERQGLKWWFYENWKYVPVFNKFKVEVLESYSKEDLTKRKNEDETKVKELLKSPYVEKFRKRHPEYPKEHLEIIVRKSQEYGIDPCLLLAMRTTENGWSGLDFGVMNPSLDTFDWQLTMSCRIVQNNINRYKRMTWDNASTEGGSFSSEFIGFLSSIYAPIGADNDPNNDNNNHLRNLLTFYWEFANIQFGNINDIVNNNYAFLKKWEVQMTSGQIIWSTTGEALIANANDHIGKWYVWGWGRWNTDVTDCSWLVLMAMKEAWVVDHWYDNTAEWLSRITKLKESPNNVVRWDLVFLQNSSWRITHVEIATWPVINWEIPIIDASSNARKVSYRNQDVNPNNWNRVLVGTPIFYKA